MDVAILSWDECSLSQKIVTEIEILAQATSAREGISTRVTRYGFFHLLFECVEREAEEVKAADIQVIILSKKLLESFHCQSSMKKKSFNVTDIIFQRAKIIALAADVTEDKIWETLQTDFQDFQSWTTLQIFWPMLAPDKTSFSHHFRQKTLEANQDSPHFHLFLQDPHAVIFFGEKALDKTEDKCRLEVKQGDSYSSLFTIDDPIILTPFIIVATFPDSFCGCPKFLESPTWIYFYVNDIKCATKTWTSSCVIAGEGSTVLEDTIEFYIQKFPEYHKTLDEYLTRTLVAHFLEETDWAVERIFQLLLNTITEEDLTLFKLAQFAQTHELEITVWTILNEFREHNQLDEYASELFGGECSDITRMLTDYHQLTTVCEDSDTSSFISSAPTSSRLSKSLSTDSSGTPSGRQRKQSIFVFDRMSPVKELDGPVSANVILEETSESPEPGDVESGSNVNTMDEMVSENSAGENNVRSRRQWEELLRGCSGEYKMPPQGSPRQVSTFGYTLPPENPDGPVSTSEYKLLPQGPLRCVEASRSPAEVQMDDEYLTMSPTAVLSPEEDLDALDDSSGNLNLTKLLDRILKPATPHKRVSSQIMIKLDSTDDDLLKMMTDYVSEEYDESQLEKNFQQWLTSERIKASIGKRVQSVKRMREEYRKIQKQRKKEGKQHGFFHRIFHKQPKNKWEGEADRRSQNELKSSKSQGVLVETVKNRKESTWRNPMDQQHSVDYVSHSPGEIPPPVPPKVGGGIKPAQVKTRSMALISYDVPKETELPPLLPKKNSPTGPSSANGSPTRAETSCYKNIMNDDMPPPLPQRKAS